MKKLLIAIIFALVATSSLAQGLPMGSATSANTINPFGQSTAGGSALNMRFPFFMGGSFGIGSGAGVGDGNNVGLCNVRPMLGVWLPGIAFLRLGYGFSSYVEKDDDKKVEVEKSDFNVDLGAHLLSEFFVMGSYSRVSALSENGDIAWNEWGLSIGTFWNVFSRTLLTLDIGYHWVLEHYDPIIEKDVSGGRMQINIGFVVFVY